MQNSYVYHRICLCWFCVISYWSGTSPLLVIFESGHQGTRDLKWEWATWRNQCIITTISLGYECWVLIFQKTYTCSNVLFKHLAVFSNGWNKQSSFFWGGRTITATYLRRERLTWGRSVLLFLFCLLCCPACFLALGVKPNGCVKKDSKLRDFSGEIWFTTVAMATAKEQDWSTGTV